MNNKQQKFENPVRIEELNPVNTLQKIGLKENHVLCDIGAGTGIFTLPAARISKNTIFALDINEEMLSIIRKKIENEDIHNIELVKVENDHLNLQDSIADIVLMVTVLHEIEHKARMLQEMKRILKTKGKLAIIEFHKRQTPMGPPLDHRLSSEDVKQLAEDSLFAFHEEFDLGDNFYCIIFT